jgi:hypothetical protein
VLLPDGAWNTNIWRDVSRMLASLPPSRASALDITFELCTDRVNDPAHVALEANWRALDGTLAGRCRTLRFVPARKTFSIPTQKAFPEGMQSHIRKMLPALERAKVLRF